MSGQARRSRVRMLEKWRRQAERLLALSPADVWPLKRIITVGVEHDQGAHFDVAAVRQHCERVLLAGIVDADAAEARSGPHGEAARLRGRARTAQRILDMLNGRCPWAPGAEAQPSECQACKKSLAGPGRELGEQVTPASWILVSCPACHGTGHNLAGVLPPIEWSPAVRRRVLDAAMTARDELAAWQVGIGIAAAMRAEVDPRVVPRGEHRNPPLMSQPTEEPDVDEGIQNRAWDAEVQQPKSLPRWRRGELKHAEQCKARKDQIELPPLISPHRQAHRSRPA